MSRFLLLCLILSAAVAAYDSETDEGSANGNIGDQEPEDALDAPLEDLEEKIIQPGSAPSQGSAQSDNAEEGSTMMIIIAAVSVVALAVVAIVAIFLFRRHLQIREQGVYTVPAEQVQKAAI